MPHLLAHNPNEPSLSPEELVALQKACAPAGTLPFPPAEVIRALRQHGYIKIVIGGLQATDKGIDRLLRERARRLEAKSNNGVRLANVREWGKLQQLARG